MWHGVGMDEETRPTVATTARQRARAEITAAILVAARARLAEVGPGDLSLRSVARDVGMVSSAVYRYFPSRDDLLTALLVQAYDELGDAVAAADAAQDGGSPLQRWRAVCRATRAWALANRQEYALLYGTPVAGYAAPQDTVLPATRVVARLVAIVLSASPAPVRQPDQLGEFGEAVDGAVEGLTTLGLAGADDPPDREVVGRTLMAWSGLFGVISFELWGHLVGSITDHDAYFDAVTARLAADIGIS